ncbi:hypothetical protein MKC84_12335 [[Clostridium] innocuum]|nr:hypothetical protein [[Clostridium] innocuum]
MDKKLNNEEIEKGVFVINQHYEIVYMDKTQNRPFPDVNSMHSAIKCCRRAKRPILTAR